jgi:hypothetical protein
VEGWLGMQGLGRWDDTPEHRPQNWRQKILQLYPNGTAPFTALMSMFPSESVDDPLFNWFEKDVPDLAGDVTGVYKSSSLASAAAYTLATNYAMDKVVYVKMSEAHASHFREGHEVLLCTDDDMSKDIIGLVTDLVKDGANSYAAVKLMQADSSRLANGATNKIICIGDSNPEGGQSPDAIAYESERKWNYTQTFWTTLMLTRTAMQTRFRTGDKYQQAKKECLSIHGAMMERAFLFGTRREFTGKNNQKQRLTHGVVNFVKDFASANFLDFKRSTETGVQGKSWKSVGEDWLMDKLEIVSRKGSGGSGNQEKLCLCGNGFLLGLNKLAKEAGHFTISAETTAYGINVHRWVTPTLTIYLKTHPQFNMLSRYRNFGIIMEPRFCKMRILQDTIYKSDPNRKRNDQGGFSSIDGIKEGYLTEIGLELNHPETFMCLNGVGLDNAA